MTIDPAENITMCEEKFNMTSVNKDVGAARDANSPTGEIVTDGQDVSAGQDQDVSAGQDQKVSAGQDQDVSAGQDQDVSAGQDQDVSAGQDAISANQNTISNVEKDTVDSVRIHKIDNHDVTDGTPMYSDQFHRSGDINENSYGEPTMTEPLNYSQDYETALRPPYGPPSPPLVNFQEKGDGKRGLFVGIENERQTCYLNSLLQVLYCTPEFRDLVLGFDASILNSDSLAMGLQLIFGQLKTHEVAISTRELRDLPEYRTSTLCKIGQADIHEFGTDLFNILEKGLQGTQYLQPLIDLSKGILADYLKCQNCGWNRIKEETFSDIALGISGHNDLEQALTEHFSAEVLNGPNQYDCSKCGTKTDAVKGATMKTVPQILRITLKRFWGDNTKLNHRVRCPWYFDVNAYMLRKDTEADQEEMLYELYAVVVHSGGLRNGHYYVYIKSLETGIWRCFDDSIVFEVSLHKVAEGFGNGRSANAYMVFYRRCDCIPSKIESFELPDDVKDLMDALRMSMFEVDIPYTHTYKFQDQPLEECTWMQG